MGSLEVGAKNAVETCMNITAEDRVVIVADNMSKSIGFSIREAALKHTHQVRFFNLDLPSYGGRPLHALPEPIRDALENATATFFVAHPFEGELKTVREPFIALALRHARHAHMVGVTRQIMEEGMNADYRKVAALTNRVYGIVKNASTIAVKSPAGTDLKITLDKNMEWIPCTGIIRTQGEWDNLPSGEVFTAPKGATGTMVVDGCVGEWIGRKYAKIVNYRTTPITIVFDPKNNGLVKSIKCDQVDLLRDLKAYINSEPNASRLGEIGLGTNIFLKELMGNMLQDEKFPGVHLALGDPYHEKTKANWSSNCHIDFVMRKCSVWVDGKQIMEDGRYLKELLQG